MFKHVQPSHVFAVLRFGEVHEVIIVHVLSVQQVTVFLLAEVLGVNAIGPQEFLIGHAKGLSNRLGD